MKPVLPFAVAACLWTTAAIAEVPRVVVTIKPLHSLVAAVMGDLGSPDLIVRGAASPHLYSLKPSDARALEAADVVVWAGQGMELFLEEALATLAVEARVVGLADAQGVELLPLRKGGMFEEHEHEGVEPAGLHGEADMHFWLDPANAAPMLSAIAAALAAEDPANAVVYASNAEAYAGRLEALTAEIDSSLAPLRERPFIVFHDAYQYFERRFGLAAAGAITVTPDVLPGAARIADIRARIEDSGAYCLFVEPQFEPAIVDTIVEGSGVRLGTLDPEGTSLTEGPELYETLLRGLADSLADCLAT